MLETLFRDPLWFLEYSLYRIPAVLIALILHECAHGLAAYRLGDPTAKLMGRLSLNPLRHLDPLGTVLMFLVGFGWAKPVPVNPRYFRRPHRDDLIVSLAGITMNLILFVLFTVGIVAAGSLMWKPEVFRANALEEWAGINSDVQSLILTGYGDRLASYMSRPGLLWLVRFLMQAAAVNLYLAIFNLLPVPPLDGSHVLNDLILKKNLFVRPQVARAGIAAVMLLSFTGILGKALGAAAGFVQGGLLRLISLAL